MSVIVRNHSNDKIECYMKGSPEKLKTLCRPETSKFFPPKIII